MRTTFPFSLRISEEVVVHRSGFVPRRLPVPAFHSENVGFEECRGSEPDRFFLYGGSDLLFRKDQPETAVSCGFDFEGEIFGEGSGYGSVSEARIFRMPLDRYRIFRRIRKEYSDDRPFWKVFCRGRRGGRRSFLACEIPCVIGIFNRLQSEGIGSLFPQGREKGVKVFSRASRVADVFMADEILRRIALDVAIFRRGTFPMGERRF